MELQANMLVAWFHRHLPDWKFRVPTGGLFLWVELPGGDSREFAQVALRHGVVVLPGPIMSATEAHTRFIRLPFLAESKTLTDGVKRLVSAWRDYESSDRRERQGAVAVV